jgi:hypothetical protein
MTLKINVNGSTAGTGDGYKGTRRDGRSIYVQEYGGWRKTWEMAETVDTEPPQISKILPGTQMTYLYMPLAKHIQVLQNLRVPIGCYTVAINVRNATHKCYTFKINYTLT